MNIYTPTADDTVSATVCHFSLSSGQVLRMGGPTPLEMGEQTLYAPQGVRS